MNKNKWSGELNLSLLEPLIIGQNKKEGTIRNKIIQLEIPYKLLGNPKLKLEGTLPGKSQLRPQDKY